MTGSLAVARSILRLVYLWDEVRVKGGAYGSGITMDRFGDFQFTSYRDPNPARSLEVYRLAPDFLRRFVADGSDLTEHVIGTAGKMSLPSSPRQTGEAATMDHLGGITAEYKMKLYEGILCADSDGILKAADLIEASLCHTATAVAGKREDLEALGDRLDEIIDV